MGVFVGILMLLEIISLKNDKAEPILDSTPSILILDGKLQIETLKDIRMTIDQLESMIREKGISSFSELRTCTLEIDGKIGFEKVKDYKPYKDNLFDELRTNKHNKPINPKLD
jgi:uncharacterized membrane protein YcaP (DUF421 family)